MNGRVLVIRTRGGDVLELGNQVLLTAASGQFGTVLGGKRRERAGVVRYPLVGQGVIDRSGAGTLKAVPGARE